MLYPIAIEPGDDQYAYGVVVPDLPGCHSAGDTLEEALINAREAITGHLACLHDAGMDIPEKQSIEVHTTNPDFAGWLWAVVDVEDFSEQHQSMRVNITLPRGLLHTIDHVAASKHMTRSGWLAEAAKRSIAQ
ncbi:MAG: type II toxin-antitoxin system HicB family antitoxin [Magnetococcales bacterium]|nr:type II toxin-antitoxin system HicB family antitoxin [Magnetococcales bacterium]